MNISKTIKTSAAILGILPVMAVALMSGPTDSQAGNKQYEYNRCAKFSIAVLNQCTDAAKGNSSKVRSCRAHYQGNIVRCQAILR